MRQFCVFFLLPAAVARPLHIVHIIADDLGWNDLAYAQRQSAPSGRAVSLTPEIDALREKGLELSSFYTWHVCGPSRAQVLTGRYPFRQGVYTNLDINSAGLPTNHSLLPQLLKAAEPRTRAHAVVRLSTTAAGLRAPLPRLTALLACSPPLLLLPPLRENGI